MPEISITRVKTPSVEAWAPRDKMRVGPRWSMAFPSGIPATHLREGSLRERPHQRQPPNGELGLGCVRCKHPSVRSRQVAGVLLECWRSAEAHRKLFCHMVAGRAGKPMGRALLATQSLESCDSPEPIGARRDEDVDVAAFTLQAR